MWGALSNVFSTFTVHKSRYHQASTFEDFKPDLVLKCHSQTLIDDEDEQLLPESEFHPVHNSIQWRIASLLLRLQAVLHVSKTAIQEIVDDLFDIGECAGQNPERQHYENVAKALVEKHPCLRDPGSEKDWYSWFHSLKFKLGNYRQKLSAAGCPEVVINKRRPGVPKGKCVKKSKKGEVNYCPDPPDGHTPENMEENRKLMEAEMLKRAPDLHLLEDLMVATFSQRRKEIIGDQPPITELISRWPALFHERQVITQLCDNSSERF